MRLFNKKMKRELEEAYFLPQHPTERAWFVRGSEPQGLPTTQPHQLEVQPPELMFPQEMSPQWGQPGIKADINISVSRSMAKADFSSPLGGRWGVRRFFAPSSPYPPGCSVALLWFNPAGSSSPHSHALTLSSPSLGWGREPERNESRWVEIETVY